MRRGIHIAKAIAMLLFLILLNVFCTTVKPVTNIHAPAAAAYYYYYGEDGVLIDSFPASVSKTFVIKASRSVSQYYQSCELNGSCFTGKEKDTAAEYTLLPGKTARAVRKSIREGNITDTLVVQNVVEILDIQLLRAIRHNIKDNGEGGAVQDNNREFGGIVQNDKTITVTEGPVVNPQNGGAHVWLPATGIAEYHSHPSGFTGDAPPAHTSAADEVMSQSVIGKKETSYRFMQGPTRADQRKAGKRMGYVFAMVAKKIIIYDSNGIVASLPVKLVE